MVSSIQQDIKMDPHIAVHCSYNTTSILLTRYFILIANRFLYTAVLTALLHVIIFSAMVYRLIIFNKTDCSSCSDEMKTMKRDLERRMLCECFAECLVFMNSYILYLVFGKGDQVLVLFYACCGIVCVLVQMKICYDVNGQNNAYSCYYV